MSKKEFEMWLKEHSNIKKITQDSYVYEIGNLSNWAISKGLIEIGLYEIESIMELDKAINIITSDKEYKMKNKTNNNKWKSALNYFNEFFSETIDQTCLKDQFEAWLTSKTKSDGDAYSEITIREYVRALEKACEEIEGLEIKTCNLFYVTSVDELKEIEAIIRSNEDFKRVNHKYGNGRLSAGIIKYTEFLKDIASESFETAWFVGAVTGGEDQSKRFVDEGIWENGYENKYLEIVKAIKIGDKIAIKSSYTRKKDLPFENNGLTVSVMGIKAIGVVTDNLMDGRRLKVEWEEVDPIREWYFYTGRNTIWRIAEEDGWMPKNLIDFTFYGKEQKIEKFLEDPYWKNKYGNMGNNQYEWTDFYQEMAYKLLNYKNNRQELLEGIKGIFNKVSLSNPLVQKHGDNTESPLTDVCPFTVFGLFNRGLTNDNRISILEGFAEFLDVEKIIPTTFDGIPVLNNMKAWFFGGEDHRGPNDIDNLWDLLQVALNLTNDFNEENIDEFIDVYDKVINQHGIQWNVTFGLYWVKPWDFLPLDNNTRSALQEKLNVTIPMNSMKKMCLGKDYINLISMMKENFEDENYPVHSFPELSYKAWSGEIGKQKEEVIELVELIIEEELEEYTKDNFLKEVFIDEGQYDTLVSLLKWKKNLILQGAPGVGKTFAAKRLAYSIMGKIDEKRIRMIQFHQSYSYEDFIMGYRPNGTGFELVKGPFYKFCIEAQQNPDEEYFFIIDEINRGNMSKVFGELMMLIETDKRGDELILTYSTVPFYVPKNLYIIGMMNTADRSLAMIDYALRRRFCFFDLEPAFHTESFRTYLVNAGAAESLVDKIINRMININNDIANDPGLGNGFRIGHSYFCNYRENETWYKEIIKYEIAPLIKEYWFDEEEKAENYIQELMQ